MNGGQNLGNLGNRGDDGWCRDRREFDLQRKRNSPISRPPAHEFIFVYLDPEISIRGALLTSRKIVAPSLTQRTTNNEPDFIRRAGCLSPILRAEMKTTKAAVAATRRRQRRHVPVCTCTAVTLLALLLLPIFCVERAQAVRVQQQQDRAEFSMSSCCVVFVSRLRRERGRGMGG